MRVHRMFTSQTPYACLICVLLSIVMLAVVCVITEHDSHLKPEQEQMQ